MSLSLTGEQLLNDLEARGLIHDSTDRGALVERLNKGPIGVYVGFDPTADSLHAGNLLGQVMLRRFQLAGHRPVVLAGGGFKRGYAHGTTDAQGMAAATDPCLPDDVSSTIFANLGIDPKLEINSSTGRPIQLFREGTVVDKLLA